MISDAVAERLEEEGLWRRAAARWLEVMQHCDTDAQREWVSQKRRECYARIELPVAERLNIHAMNQAASAAQEKMGISQPDGQAFRMKSRKK
ncbi:PerC family transcriptional regulator [Enterobacter roggenkampii]